MNKYLKRAFLISVLLATIFINTNLFAQFGFSSPIYTGPDKDLMENEWSSNFDLFFSREIVLKDTSSKYISLIIEPGLKWEWYNFKKDIIVNRFNNYTDFIIDENPNHTYRSGLIFRTTSLMQTSSFQVPISLYLKPKGDRSIILSPGIYLEYIYGGKFKRRYKNNGNKVIVKSKFEDEINFYGLNRFQFGFRGQISWRFMTFYGGFALTKLFKQNQGIDTRRYIAGVYFNLFWRWSEPTFI